MQVKLPKDYGMVSYGEHHYKCMHCPYVAKHPEEHSCKGYIKPLLHIKLFTVMETYGKYFSFLL